MKIVILAVGGTFDKVYYDALSDYRIGEAQVGGMLEQAQVGFEYAVETMISKDSLDMTDTDRKLIYDRIVADNSRHFVITHGTDTMVNTAQVLEAVQGKTIVLTGAMQPARFRDTDAHFNVGFAVCAAQLLPEGVYIAMNGEIFSPSDAVKNRAAGRFEQKE